MEATDLILSELTNELITYINLDQRSKA